jgi:V/A-type H+-transporting ATPase subunit K
MAGLFTGTTWAFLGALIAVVMAGFGSAYAVGKAGEYAAGILADDPDKFSKVLLLQALPGTQGIYGLLAAFMVLSKIGAVGSQIQTATPEQGFALFLACLPIAIVGLASAIFQMKVAVASMNVINKKPDQLSKGMTITVMVETYAVLALLASILLILGVKL